MFFLRPLRWRWPCASNRPEISGAEPAVHDGFGGEFGIVEIAGHDGFAAHPDFAYAILGGVGDFDFHAGERLADGVRTEGLSGR
jgi:hypothetical protein